MDLSSLPAIDPHVHSILRGEVAQTLPLAGAFSQGYEPTLVSHHTRHTLSYRRSLRDLARLFHCEPTEEAICRHRSTEGTEAIARHCIQAAHLNAIALDEGSPPHGRYPLDWYQQMVPSYRLIQLEHLAEQLLATVDRFDVFLEWFRSEIDPLPDRAVGFKSVAACRTGLDIQFVYREMAEDAFFRLKQHQVETQTALIPLDKTLIDFLLLQALEVAATYSIPVQFHTGFGSPDLDLRLANPLHLRPIFEEPRYRTVPIVLLHGAYPFSREAGFLTSLYSNAYVDFGFAIPALSIRGMRTVVEHLLELAPMTKVMYSSGTQLLPERLYLGATWGREIVGQVLEDAVQDGEVSAHEAEEGAIAILHHNARDLYSFPKQT